MMKVFASRGFQRIKPQEVSIKQNLLISDKAKEFLEKELTDFHSKCSFVEKIRYFGLKKFNFEKVLETYKNAVTSVIDQAKGDMFLIMERRAKGEKPRIEMRFQPEGRFSALQSGGNGSPTMTVAPTDILADRLFSSTNPMKHAKSLTEFRISELFNSNKASGSQFKSY